MAVPFLNGLNSSWKFIIGGNSLVLAVKSWDIGRNVTKINDGVCGETRDRLDTLTNYFEITLTCWQTNTKDAVEKFISDHALDDSGVAPTDKSAAIIIKPRDGSKAAYTAKGLVLDDWKLNSGGRTERVMLAVPLRSQTFEKAGGL